MITHIDSSDLDVLIIGHREIRDCYVAGQCRWVLETHTIDALQRLRKALFGEYLTPIFYKCVNHDNTHTIGRIERINEDDLNDICSRVG